MPPSLFSQTQTTTCPNCDKTSLECSGRVSLQRVTVVSLGCAYVQLAGRYNSRPPHAFHTPVISTITPQPIITAVSRK